MALFRNFGVNRRNRLCGVHEYASAQFFDFLELAENGDFWFGNVSVPFMNPRMGTSLRSRIESQWIKVRKNCATSSLISVKPGISYPTSHIILSGKVS